MPSCYVDTMNREARPWFAAYANRVQDHAGIDDASPRTILSTLFDLYRPRSVVDIGCGPGGWSREAANLGVTDIISCDIPEENRASFPPGQFVEIDLNDPTDLGRTFDLAICAEVAEHLPATAADNVVATVCRHAPIAIFGAASPLQGGKGHINEQWPHYWAQRFATHGYRAYDLFRTKLWNDRRVRFYYRQNTFVYADEEHGQLLVDAGYPALDQVDPYVHPEMFFKLAAAESRDGPGVVEGLLDQLYE